MRSISWPPGRTLAGGLVAALMLAAACPAQAFCGFFVGKADSSLFNQASQVILVRDGQRTVISMLNDYRGDLKAFALVVPVPSVLQREQINVGDRKLFERIDSYSSPRLAEYFDPDPCARYEMSRASPSAANAEALSADSKGASAKKALGVTVEASYTIGEYDIVMLSARESDGLETWLTENGYRIPAGASAALQPYIKQGMKFFVAKVNLEEQARIASTTGFMTLRPLQFAFETPKFMLPMRLGMINSNGPQDLIVYVLTRRGRVESSNYRTVKLPADIELPLFVRSDFRRFYQSMFERQAQREDFKVVFTEYFWDMGWCDPCAADPLSTKELRQAGVFWLNERIDPVDPMIYPPPPDGAWRAPRPRPGNAAQPVLLTRLHLRYTRASFPEDLMFQQTSDHQNFQTRYVLRHPFAGSPTACDAARVYYDEAARRQVRNAETLANLTGWNLTEIRGRMNIGEPSDPDGGRPWWSSLWKS